MRIAIDYDGTYTRDPAMWDVIIAVANAFAKARLTEVEFICVTSRRYTDENVAEISKAMPQPMRFVFCGYKPKAEHMDKIGLHVDVWIDDDPKTIDPNGVIEKPEYDEWKASGK